MYHDQWELNVLLLCIILFHFNGRQDCMKDETSFFASEIVICVEDKLEHPGAQSLVSVLNSICEKLIQQVLVERNSMLAYIIMQGISKSSLEKKLFSGIFVTC